VWDSKDIAFVVIFSVLNFVYSALVGQLARLFSGIAGSNLLLIIGGVIINAFTLLYFDGRRWRFALTNILFALLTIPTNFSGVPFDVVGRIPIFIVPFITDILFNSLYGFFKRKNQLFFWVIFDMLVFFLITPFSYSLFFSCFYAPDVASAFINTVLLLLPVVIIESIIGAVVGYRIFQRLKRSGLI
jgi:hypothetical protein